ncbi:radical SAM protein, partial [Candidatus Woesearchaeota archaeon]|nr:radical SAM protein [Candidatus Woesearchaeota archaeon]
MAYLTLGRKLKLAKSYLLSLKSNSQGYPFWVHFYLTRKCNLKCKYCFVVDNKKKELNTNEIMKALDKLYSLGVRAVAFFGGEPTLRKDFCRILRYSVNKGFFTYFTTNGVLLNKDYIEKIGKTGVDFIELSIDSIFAFNESKKDYSHSRNVFGLLLKAKKKYGFGLKTHFVLTKKNMDSAVETIRLIHSYRIPLTVGLVFRNVYNNIPDDEALYFNNRKSKEKLIRIVDRIIKLKKQGLGIMDPIIYFKGIKNHLNGKTNGGCTAGRRSLSVDCDGAVQLCC